VAPPPDRSAPLPPAGTIRVTVRPNSEATYVTRSEDFTASPVTVGRSRDCDLVLEGEGVSRYHARIERRAGQLFVEDLNSANGTLVDGRPTNGQVLLRASDVVQVGEFLLSVTLT
jgi:pSer/pThr/pTyr-binding forkhead associated (FHA) protein